jgi:hypothetical protein
MMIVAVATGHMELVSGASQLAIVIADALMKMGHEAFIVTSLMLQSSATLVTSWR